jgi:hypothetical protein
LSKPLTADTLIADAKQPRDALPDALRVELAKLMKHNDRAPRDKRVTVDAAIKLCAVHGYRCGESKFDRMVRREFGRKWSGQ